MIAVFFAVMSAIAAELGGLLALKRHRNLHLTLAFTAGALIGLVAFDLLPEIFHISSTQNLDITYPMITLVVGFLLFHTIEKTILIHHSHEQQYAVHKHPHVGLASAAALIGHSFLDGMSIGIAFQVNNAAGVAVALAVIGHRFADGFNGVNLMLSHEGSRESSIKVLYVVAAAPILGAIATRFFTLSETVLALYLGFFAGFLIYIAASDILPQAHSQKSTRFAIVLTFVGAAAMFVLTRFL